MKMNMNFFFISPPSEMKFPMSPQSDRVRMRLCVRVHACMRAQRRVHALFRLTWKWNENENEFPSQSKMKLFISPRSERVLVAACAHLPINQQCSQHSQSSSDFGKRAGGHSSQWLIRREWSHSPINWRSSCDPMSPTNLRSGTIMRVDQLHDR